VLFGAIGPYTSAGATARKLVVTKIFSALTLVSNRESANNRRTARAERQRNTKQHTRMIEQMGDEPFTAVTGLVLVLPMTSALSTIVTRKTSARKPGTPRDTRPSDRIASSAPKRTCAPTAHVHPEAARSRRVSAPAPGIVRHQSNVPTPRC
jgi:hypothetical protein